MMDDNNMPDNGNSIPGLPIDLSYLAYAAPFIGAILIGCFALSLCCYLWRRVFTPRGYSNSFESSSNSYRNRRPFSAQAQTQRERGQTGERRNVSGVGHQFVSWARGQMNNYPRNPTQLWQDRRTHDQTQARNNLLSPMAAQQYPTANLARLGNNHNTGRMPTQASSNNMLSDSDGFSRATAPPPSYSHAVEFQNAPPWKIPGYGYQSTEPRNGGPPMEGLRGVEADLLPPPYEAAVANGENTRRT